MNAQKAEDYVRHEVGRLVAAKVLNFQTGKIVLRASLVEAEIILNPRFSDVDGELATRTYAAPATGRACFTTLTTIHGTASRSTSV
jgi:hypothetical protein